jgi:hypothetical protein
MRIWARLVDFCLTNIFSFFGGAKFGEFRPARWLQVVCWSLVGV